MEKREARGEGGRERELGEHTRRRLLSGGGVGGGGKREGLREPTDIVI